MPRTSKQMELLILADGWVFERHKGAHRHYKHPTKNGWLPFRFITKT